MNIIAPGTPCYLVGLAEMDLLCGRVVEVVRGPIHPPEERGDWYVVAAAWAGEMFPGREMQSARENLLPITPPQPTAPGALERLPEKTH